jgi:hypothetical protein
MTRKPNFGFSREDYKLTDVRVRYNLQAWNWHEFSDFPPCKAWLASPFIHPLMNSSNCNSTRPWYQQSWSSRTIQQKNKSDGDKPAGKEAGATNMLDEVAENSPPQQLKVTQQWVQS